MNHGNGDALLTLDPDLTYASWLAGLVDRVTTDFFLYLRATNPNIPMVGVQLQQLNFPILKDQQIFIAPATNAIIQLYFEELLAPLN